MKGVFAAWPDLSPFHVIWGLMTCEEMEGSAKEERKKRRWINGLETICEAARVWHNVRKDRDWDEEIMALGEVTI